ncbi:MAG TPA: hypothetical protein VI299_08490 [Polyangiales bacterium]
MSGPTLRTTSPKVVVEHVSTFGPAVTHVRGSLIVGSLENMREIGASARYESLLPANMRDAILYALATSWVPIDVACAHYRTCDQLDLTQEQLTRIGELTANRIIDTFMGRAMRASRNAGAETYWALMKQTPRIYDRMYQGGGVTVLQTGPKDMLIENTGQPLAEFRYWRSTYVTYTEAMGKAFTKVAYVKLARPRVYHTHTIAVAGSWV